MRESSELKLWLLLEGLETCQRATLFAGLGQTELEIDLTQVA